MPNEKQIEAAALAMCVAAGEDWDAATSAETHSGNMPEDMRDGWRDLARAALSAAGNAEPVAWAVKPLEWVEIGGPTGTWWSAKNPLGGLHYEAAAQEERKRKDADYERRIRSALEPVKASPWQPIETAPKDGTWFLAYRGAVNSGTWDRLIFSRWHDEIEDFVWPEDVFDIYDGDMEEKDDSGYFVHTPYQSGGTFTHWMPLPPTPEAPHE